MNKRLAAIDIIRGISITLIILSHTTSSSDMLRKFLFAFHVPIFFAISGFFYTNNKKKIIKRVVFWLGLYIILTAIDIICVYFFSPSYFTKKIILNGFLGLDSQLVFNSPKWYLLTLSEIELCYYFIFECKNRIKILVCILGAILANCVHIHLLFGLQIVFSSWIFFSFGNMIKPYLQKNFCNNILQKKKLVITICIGTCALWILSQLNGTVSIQDSKFGNSYILFLANAFGGIFLLYLLGILISNNKILEFLGRNTLIFLCLHYYLIRGLFPKLIPQIYSTFCGKIFGTLIAILCISILIKLLETIKVKKLVFNFRN